MDGVGSVADSKGLSGTVSWSGQGVLLLPTSRMSLHGCVLPLTRSLCPEHLIFLGKTFPDSAVLWGCSPSCFSLIAELGGALLTFCLLLL